VPSKPPIAYIPSGSVTADNALLGTLRLAIDSLLKQNLKKIIFTKYLT